MVDLANYQWKADFHKLLWEKLKKANPRLPKLTFEQLTFNGWTFKLSTVRGALELAHKDGESIRFKLTIGGQTLPHPGALLCRLCGYETNDQAKQDIDSTIMRLGTQFPGFGFEKNVEDPAHPYITCSTDNIALLYDFFSEIGDGQEDASYELPIITTAKYFFNSMMYGEFKTNTNQKVRLNLDYK